MNSKIRVVTNGLMGHNVRVYFIQEDGSQVDISAHVRGVDLSIHVGETNRARLDVLVDEVEVEAEVLSPKDVTTLADRVRRYAA